MTVGGATTTIKSTTTEIKTQPPSSIISNVGIGVTGQNVVLTDATLDLFNRFVAKDTHCLLGKTGMKLSRIALGTMNFGHFKTEQFGSRPGQLSEEEAYKVLCRFVELGGNCIDTADFFPWFGNENVGRTEEIIGNWLSTNPELRERVFLITKCRMPLNSENINSVGLSRSHLIESVEHSLKRLQSPCIDMLMLNGWDQTVSFHETVRHLNDLVESGRVRYIGVCDMKGWQLQKLIDAAKILNMHKCVCYMGEYNLLSRGCELEVLEVCKRERIGFIAYSPLKYGFFTNDFVNSLNERQQPVPNSRIESVQLARTPSSPSPSSEQEQPEQPEQHKRSRRTLNLAAMAESFDSIRQNPLYMNVLNSCMQLSQKYNCSVSQIALQWILQKGVVTSICIGVEDVKELEANMACLLGNVLLTQQDMDLLDMVSSIELPYPYRTQLADVAGFRKICTTPNTEFEQLNLLTEALELDTIRERRMNVQETLHEGLHQQQLPEREFQRYIQMKQPQQWSAQNVLQGSIASSGLPSPFQQQQFQQQPQQQFPIIGGFIDPSRVIQ